MKWTFEVCQNWESIWSNDYQTQWLHLLDISPHTHIFFYPPLVEVWMKTYLPIRNLTPIFIWGKKNDNEVFLPLVLWKKNWKNAFLKTIVPVGYSDYDYHEPIFKSLPPDLIGFWDDLYSFLKTTYHPDEIDITGIREEFTSKTSEWIKEEGCPFLSLENIHSNEELMNFFKVNLRNDIRRRIRRLQEQGELHLKEYQSAQEVRTTFEKFMKEHCRKWPNAYKAPHFHENLLSDLLLNSNVHFSSLNLGNTPIAWHLGFSDKETYYYYMPVANHKYTAYSPVKIHLYYLLNRAIRMGYIKYDHLRGEENYKNGWSNGCDFVYHANWNNDKLTTKIKLYFINQIKKRL